MQPERYIDPDGAALLAAAIVRQAVDDYRAGYTKHGTPSARAFLKAAGLLTAADTLDPRLHQPHRRRRAPVDVLAAA